jgi:hypothetical protein
MLCPCDAGTEAGLFGCTAIGEPPPPQAARVKSKAITLADSDMLGASRGDRSPLEPRLMRTYRGISGAELSGRAWDLSEPSGLLRGADVVTC